MKGNLGGSIAMILDMVHIDVATGEQSDSFLDTSFGFPIYLVSMQYNIVSQIAVRSQEAESLKVESMQNSY